MAVVITAAGRSTRMGGRKKELEAVEGIPVIKKAVDTFKLIESIRKIVITFPPGGEHDLKALFGHTYSNLIWVPGGRSRQESVFHALSALTDYNPDYALIHDAARPWVTGELIEAVIQGAMEHGACIPVVSHVNAPKKIDDSGEICEHLNRALVVGAQTPQGFRFPEIYKAHEIARSNRKEYPDDAEAYHHAIGPVHAVPGDPVNRKITFRHDL